MAVLSREINSNERTMIKVFIIDDKISLNDIKTQLLDPTITVIGEAYDGITGIALLAKLSPDVLILDFNLPDITGLEVFNRIYKRRSKMKTVFITPVHTPTIVRILNAKPHGILIKNSNFSYAEAIKTIMRGEPYTEPTLAYKIVNYIKKGHNVDELTDRELEVLIHFSRGRSLEKTAEILGVCTKTICNAKQSAIRKIGTNNIPAIHSMLYGEERI